MSDDASSMQGFAPEVLVQPVKPERPTEEEIYKLMWEHAQYRTVAPGEDVASLFLDIAKPLPGASVLDLGCGTGRGSFSLALAGLNVTMLDFADNCLDDDIRDMLEHQGHAMRFEKVDLAKPFTATAEYGFCTDVLEHIPPEQVDLVLNNVLMAAQHVFFQISTVEDTLGALIGHQLHLTVRPYEWWLKKFQERDCMIHWSGLDDDGLVCCFYVSAWTTGKEMVDVGILNIAEEKLRENVRVNTSKGYRCAEPHVTNDIDAMILGGGPSLNDHVDEIRELRKNGVKLIALNGAHDWCLDHDIVPSAMIMVDARDFNARFTRRPIKDCWYMLASQCDPTAFEGIPHEQVILWHTTADMIREELDAVYGAWYGVPGGSTVLLRAIPLLRMLGYRKYHLFGCDSCLSEDEVHHAYAQPENDGHHVTPVIVDGRIFKCHPWMLSQAQEFMDLIKVLGNEFELEVHGDGLLGHIINTGAKLSLENVNGA